MNTAVNYTLSENGSFVIDNYNESPLWSSFLPGIAGKMGIPIWAFYVNRGQGISSFGTQNKDHAILEFYAADKAYQLTASRGFRTFLKIDRGGKVVCYEAFQRGNGANLQRLTVKPHQFEIEEENKELEIRLHLKVFTLPESIVGGLVRILTIENTSKTAAQISYLDGLGQMLPYGLNRFCYKNMSRTMEAFNVAENVENNAPYLHLKVYPDDKAEVEKVEAGNFFAGFSLAQKSFKRSTAVVDATRAFGLNADFSSPELFWAQDKLNLKGQVISNQNFAAMHCGQIKIEAQKQAQLFSLFGHAKNLEALNQYLDSHIVDEYFFLQKEQQNQTLIHHIVSRASTTTANAAFNAYTQQSFLDNLLRGGLPEEVSGQLLYLYGRKHGDLERDYNEFNLQDTVFSQGNSDFRDGAQNRRCDLAFYPQVGTSNIKLFFSLIQLDGYNPLVLKPTRFSLRDKKSLLKQKDFAKCSKQVQVLENKDFGFADLWFWLTQNFKNSRELEQLAKTFLSYCDIVADAEFEKGYWSDHWTYLTDFLDNYLSIYPDRLSDLLYRENDYSFYDSPAFVKARNDKYVLTARGVRQQDAVHIDEKKEHLIQSRAYAKHFVRDVKGNIVRTNLASKILSLILNKFASLDPEAMGVEMEAGRPGWCDALNGLPSLLGSSMNETLELKRLVDFLADSFSQAAPEEKDVRLVEEMEDLFKGSSNAAQKLNAKKIDAFAFWDQTHKLKESYRSQVFYGVSGKEFFVSIKELQTFLSAAQKVLSNAIVAAKNKQGLMTTYYSYQALSHKTVAKKNGKEYVSVSKFKQQEVPLFLEGQVHAMRLSKNVDEARSLYRAVMASALLDKKLGMFHLNVALDKNPNAFEYGRIGIFNYGWLENGSIFLHMHYKFVMEMIRNGLLEEFYTNINKLLVPFLDPKIYRRSITENVSFIASSGYTPNPDDHGRGFVARLSGSTVEFLHIRSLLFFGEKPFTVNEKGDLIFALNPALDKDFFFKEETHLESGQVLSAGSLACTFLGSIPVVYHNPSLKNTYGAGAVKVQKYALTDASGKKHIFEGANVSGPSAQKIRNREFKQIEVYLG